MHLIFEQIALEDRTEDWFGFPISGEVLKTILHDVATYACVYYLMKACNYHQFESEHLDLVGLQLPSVIASNIEMHVMEATEDATLVTYLAERFRLTEGPSDDRVALQRFHSGCVILRMCTAWFREHELDPRMIEIHCHCGSSLLRFGEWTRCNCSEITPTTGTLPSTLSVQRLAMRLGAATLADRSVIRFSF